MPGNSSWMPCAAQRVTELDDDDDGDDDTVPQVHFSNALHQSTCRRSPSSNLVVQWGNFGGSFRNVLSQEDTKSLKF